MLVILYIGLTVVNILFRSWAISILWNLFMPRTFHLPMVSTLPVLGVLLMVSMFTIDKLPSEIEDQDDLLTRTNWSLVINMVLAGVTLIGGVICSLYL